MQQSNTSQIEIAATQAQLAFRLQAAAVAAPLQQAINEANLRAAQAETDAKNIVSRAREMAVHAVAASQIDANARVLQAEQARLQA